MPANESTWRDQKQLHVLFAISGAILFFATIWMFVKDHSREWKEYQLQARQVQITADEWQEQATRTVEYRQKHAELEQELMAAKAKGFDEKLLNQFKASINTDLAQRYMHEQGDGADINNAPTYDFAKFDLAYAELQKVAGDASDARQAAKTAEAAAQQAAKEYDTALIERTEAEKALKAAAADAKEQAAADLKTKSDAVELKKTARDEAIAQAKEADAKAIAAEIAAGKQRASLLETMRAFIAAARFREDRLSGERKFQSANLDKAKADEGIGVRDSLSADAMKALVEKVEVAQAIVDKLTLRYQAAMVHRETLQKIAKTITAEQDEIAKQLDANSAQLVTLEKAIVQKRSTYVVWWGPIPTPGKKWIELPILDAFNSPLKIENLWSDGLTIDYNFKDVRRYDRCTTCHQLMEKSQPSNSGEGLYVKERLLTLILTPPSEEKLAELKKIAGDKPLTVEDIYGVSLTAGGLVNRNAVSITNVVRDSLGSRARLKLNPELTEPETGEEIRNSLLMTSTAEQQMYALDNPANPFAPSNGLFVGDVLVDVDGSMVYTLAEAERFLLEGGNAGRPLTLLVRRGLANPYTSHPRLDLFVGPLSPHKMQEFACTICHDGQGSATEFKWVSHTPNDVVESKEWVNEHGWFDNHHWIYPMQPKRFAESSCLKCHHEVVDLEPSERFPEPPAPKVTHGYDLIRKYGCYGCHEINGYDGPNKRIGPDLRLEPNFFAAAQQLKADPNYEKLTAEERFWVETIIEHPERSEERNRVAELLKIDEANAEPRLSKDAYQLAPLFKDADAPGTLRKPGPSLRYVDQKLDTQFMYDWIANPRNFRPSTRMPRVFGLWDHLDGEGLHMAQDYEPVEIEAISTYLRGSSQKFDYLQPPAEVKLAPDAERGKVQFQTRGCLACHSHAEFADADAYRDPQAIVQGPDLSNLAKKFDPERNPNGPKWLYSWIKEPTRYHARTVMPNLFLDPLPVATGKMTVKKVVDGQEQDVEEDVLELSDPVADIVEYLLTSTAGKSSDWSPKKPDAMEADEDGNSPLDKLLVEYLSGAFTIRAAEQYAKNGIPASRAADLKGAERDLLLSEGQESVTQEQKMTYLGRKSIAKYGCYGCHDIPGFEDAKPIGAGLNDWGRKESSKLTFEHILEYLHTGHHPPMQAHDETAERTVPEENDNPAAAESASENSAAEPAAEAHAAHGHAAGEHADDHEQVPPWFMMQLNAGNRTGFLYQKLREPRSYDWKKVEFKKYNDRLRMPQFPFNEADREAVMTFVLGLVADPPEPKYVFQPDPRQQAIIDGQKVLEKYNCQSCHILQMEQWKLAFAPDTFGEQLAPEDAAKTYPFLMLHVPPELQELSKSKDRRGLNTANLSIMPRVRASDGRPDVADENGDPLEEEEEYDPTKTSLSFDLWQPAVLSGEPFLVGLKPETIPFDMIEKRHAAQGGFLTRYLLPVVTQLDAQASGSAKGGEAMAWLPPPLIGEGKKVQSAWLHEFLLEPYPIRPAVYLRMPKFNMSPDEATQLAAYFAAVDNAEYPYTFARSRQASTRELTEAEYQARWSQLAASDKPAEGSRYDHAMNIVVSGNYCVKCHIVSDFMPKSSQRSLGPDLSKVYSRLRPDYLREWIANPKTKLPYTAMPINIPYDAAAPHLGGVDQKLYHGTSIEQLDGLVDLLMNFDQYSKSQANVSALEEASREAAAKAEAEKAAAEAAQPPATDDPKPETPEDN